ncbi:GTPase HflX [Halopiger djelfimassiliensis]|uniref:GTPase HflX n=1 Tax=Halopiger djelfimassiliensis TaxID=1293047 RepID=UPI000677C812|nr:GTPase HflX [Halopiger djelfimassiliensis]
MSRPNEPNRRTVIAKRSPTAPVETDEIRALARATGYAVVAERTQVGPADPGTVFGAGTVDELATLARTNAADCVVVDDTLTPSQHCSLESAMPDGTTVIDRYRLVLERFEQGADTRRAQLQVELARLQYELPRLIESADEGLLNAQTEKGSPVYDVRDRIDHLRSTLEELPDPADQFRSRRRESGFDLVTIAGYTNAGKSTLLRRLADDLSLAAADERPPDRRAEDSATVADRLFETLETTTRRVTIDGRPVLATDTVGFVDELPHDLVESFSSTLSEAAAADVVVLVVDASEPPEQVRERLAVSLEVLEAQGVDDDRIVPALNKVDRLSRRERARRCSLAEAVLPTAAAEPIPVSVRERHNLESLREAVRARLPEAHLTRRLPNCDETMSLVSRAYDRTTVDAVDYDGDEVTLTCRGRPSVIEQLRAAADRIAPRPDRGE